MPMRHKGLCILFTFVLAVLFGSLAEAQLSGEYADWEDGPEGFLLTKKERKQWSKIKNDADAEGFIELFWAKRNPDPTSSVNVFKADFERRVRYADENFAYGKYRGATSDRGKVLILLGPPRKAQTESSTDGTISVTSGAQGAGQVTGDFQAWLYDPLTMPKGFDVPGSNLILWFQEMREGTNEFVLERTNRVNASGLALLGDAPDVYLLHPDMVKVPKPVSVAGGRSPDSAHLAWIGADTEWNNSAVVIAEAGVTDATSRPLWIHIELPPEAPVLDVLAGQVKSSAGEVLSTFEIDATPIAAQSGNAYHLSFPLAPGEYAVEVSGGAGGVPVISQSIQAELAPIPETGTWLSPMWAGISAKAEKGSVLGAPFCFGGWHIVPVSGPELTRENEISYFGFMVRPGTDEEGAIKLKVRIRVTRDGKPLGRSSTLSLEVTQIAGDLYMYGNSILLSGLPEPGEYGLEFEITDKVSEITVERELQLNITE